MSVDDETAKKPKRPLSAYNLFFQFERERILSRLCKGKASCTNLVTSDVATNPFITGDCILADNDYNYTTITIRDVLYVAEKNRSMKNEKRRHRKSHGKIGFVALSRQIAQHWKALDIASRQTFETCAQIEKQRYDHDALTLNYNAFSPEMQVRGEVHTPVIADEDLRYHLEVERPYCFQMYKKTKGALLTDDLNKTVTGEAPKFSSFKPMNCIIERRVQEPTSRGGSREIVSNGLEVCPSLAHRIDPSSSSLLDHQSIIYPEVGERKGVKYCTEMFRAKFSPLFGTQHLSDTSTASHGWNESYSTITRHDTEQLAFSFSFCEKSSPLKTRYDHIHHDDQTSVQKSEPDKISSVQELYSPRSRRKAAHNNKHGRKVCSKTKRAPTSPDFRMMSSAVHDQDYKACLSPSGLFDSHQEVGDNCGCLKDPPNAFVTTSSAPLTRGDTCAHNNSKTYCSGERANPEEMLDFLSAFL